MLRLGSALRANRAILVAQYAGQEGFLDATRAVRSIAAVATLDDLLELRDAELRRCLGYIRGAARCSDVAGSEIRLLCPLTRPTRIRDCGMITTHLRPAFAQMIERLRQMDDVDTGPAVQALESRLRGAGKRALSWGERDPATLSASCDPIANAGGELDFELEMAVAVRRRDNGDPEIFGYTLYNDWTLRDVQVQTFARTLNLHGPAKNFRGSNSFGPMIVMADDVADPMNQILRIEVDGQLFAEDTLAAADWTIPEAVAELYSREPISGTELLGSGTVLGGSMFERGLVLRPGSRVVLSNPSIGTLENRAGEGA